MQEPDDVLNVLRNYSKTLTGSTQVLPQDVEFGLEIGADLDPYNQLIVGLTTFYRACEDITDLFRAASTAKEGKLTLEKHIIGVLFEVRQRIDPWVAENVRAFYQNKGRNPSRVLQIGKKVRQEYKPHLATMKEIRNRVFHRGLWHHDEAINHVTRLMYERSIPGYLHTLLIEYGVDSVGAMFEDGIGIPGVGCFGVIPIDGAGRMKLPFDHPYMPK